MGLVFPAYLGKAIRDPIIGMLRSNNWRAKATTILGVILSVSHWASNILSDFFSEEIVIG